MAVSGKAKAVAAVRLERAPKARRAKGDVVTEHIAVDPRSRKTVRRDRCRALWWLDRYAQANGRRAAVLDAAQYDAGLELRRAWYAKRGQRWEDKEDFVPCGDGDADAELGHAHVQHAERILRDFYSPAAGLTIAQKVVIVRVCLIDEAAGDSVKLTALRRGLDAMARYWAAGRPVSSGKVPAEVLDNERRIMALLA